MSSDATAEMPPAAADSDPQQQQMSGGAEAGGEAEAEATEEEIAAMQAQIAALEEEEEREEQRRLAELAGGGAAAAAAASNAAGGSSTAAASPASALPYAASSAPNATPSPDAAEVDSRSVHVSQVDYSVSEEELQRLFEACGAVNRVTILRDRYSGQPKGFAYVEFASADSVANAMILNDTEYKGRTLKIAPKRTNLPGFARGGRGGRGRGRGGRGGFEGGYSPMRGGRGGRGRGRGGYHPYQY